MIIEQLSGGGSIQPLEINVVTSARPKKAVASSEVHFALTAVTKLLSRVNSAIVRPCIVLPVAEERLDRRNRAGAISGGAD